MGHKLKCHRSQTGNVNERSQAGLPGAGLSRALCWETGSSAPTRMSSHVVGKSGFSGKIA